MNDKLARDIGILAALFKEGGWTEIRVESDTLGLLLSNDRATPGIGQEGVVVRPAPAPAPAPARAPAPAPAPVGAGPIPARPPAATDEPIDPAWAVVPAPNLGTFYRSPKPGAAPFVEVGQHVKAGSELCLIEVMKLFTSVRADLTGTVRHIAVADAELVEGGQPLIYIEPDQ